MDPLQLGLTSIAGYLLGGQVKGYFTENKAKIAPVVGIIVLLANVVWDLAQGQFGVQTFAIGGVAALAPVGFHELLKGVLLSFFKK